MSNQLRILFFDIETAPLLAHIWRPYDGYVNHQQLLHDSFLLTWSAKWRGEDKMHSMRLTSQEAQDQDDSRLVAGLADMVRKADIVVAHNADRFDIPMLNNRLLVMQLEPLGPTRTIDTLKLAKYNFRLAYNKLDYLAEVLGFGKKIKTEFDLWRQSYLGDAKALKLMETYNKHDVVLLEQVFEALLPYVHNLPRLYDAEREMEQACPTCGSDDLKKDGKRRTNSSTYQRYHCRNCGRYSRSRSSDRLSKLGVHPL
jgi:DNA polymerase III epsilon subunit-like protein